jgi:hypothetical protein
VPVDPTEDNSLPIEVVNNYYLGNILKKVFEELYSENEEPPQQPLRSQNLIALLGL